MSTIIDGYNDSHRAFLQAFLSQGVLTLESAKPILAAILSVQRGHPLSPVEISADDLTSFISSANQALSPLDFEIRGTLHQASRERYYALVNATSDAFTQLATTFTAEEIGYVKRLLDGMFEGVNNRGRREAMCLSSIEAVQLGKTGRRQDGQSDQTNLHGLNLREAEGVLDRLQAEGWLEKSRKGFYALSPRSLLELRGWLVDTYNDPADAEDGGNIHARIKFCHACKDIITVGQRCPDYTCPCRLHDICTQNFFRIRRSHNCPLCQAEWGGDHYVGEKAITTSESYQKGKRRSLGTTLNTDPSSSALQNNA